MNDINQILEDEEVRASEIKQLLQNSWFNADPQGRPLWIFDLGRLDLEGLMLKVTVDQLTTYLCAELEHTWREKMLTLKSDQLNILIDMSGASCKPNPKLVGQLKEALRSEIVENYPGIVHSILVVNCPEPMQQ